MPTELEQALRENVYPITVAKHQILQSSVEHNNALYFVEKGLFRYYNYEADGERTAEFRCEDQFMHYNEILMRDHRLTKTAFRWLWTGDSFETFRSFCEHFPNLPRRVPLKYLASLTGIPEKMLSHLLESVIRLHTGVERRRKKPGT